MRDPLGGLVTRMPFTLSHPAAVAPFWPLVRRGHLPLCALAVGTMSPDFEYLWRLRTEWRWSHTPLGVFYFCLPVGLITVGIWVALVRMPTRRLLALPPTILSTSNRWWIFAAVAIVIGAFTHILWDGFTHGFGWATNLAPILRQKVWFGGTGIPVFNLLQHLSTIVGGLVVIRWLVHEVRSGVPQALPSPWRIAVVASLGTIAMVVALWNALRASPVSGYWTAQVQVARAGVGGLLGLGLGLVVYAIVYHLVARSMSQAA